MKTAAIGTDKESRDLIESLATEVQTPGTSPKTAEAERIALAVIRELADLVAGRKVPSGAMEWTRAGRAIEQWIAAASF